MGTSDLESALRSQAPRFKKISWAVLILSVIFTAGLIVDLAVINTPSVHTDLADFSPDSESAEAHERISAHYTNETRPRYVHVTTDNGANVLQMSKIH